MLCQISRTPGSFGGTPNRIHLELRVQSLCLIEVQGNLKTTQGQSCPSAVRVLSSPSPTPPSLSFTFQIPGFSIRTDPHTVRSYYSFNCTEWEWSKKGASTNWTLQLPVGYAETPFGLGPCPWTAFSLYSLCCPSSQDWSWTCCFLDKWGRGASGKCKRKGGALCPELNQAVYMILLNLSDPFVLRFLIRKMWKIVTATSSRGFYENKWDNLHNFLRTGAWPGIKHDNMTYYYYYYYCPDTSWSWFGSICTRRHLKKIYPGSVNPWSKWVSFSSY